MNMWVIHRLIGESSDRGKIGQAGSLVGIVVNALLAALKFAVGAMTGSVAVAADAVNNLSDAGGSMVALVTMRMAQKPVDKEHPFGHGRMEYIGALAVGALILLMGFELFKDSISSILHPELLTFGWVSLFIMLVSILMKLWLYRFYREVGTSIDSSALLAASKDSLSDVIATSAVVVSMLVGYFFRWPVDGWMGLVVALLIFKAGFDVCKSTIDLLLGGEPNQELGRKICDMVLAYDQILGVHDLMVHDYGPGRCMASLHAEVPADGSLIDLHEIIDRAEQEIAEKLNIIVCIHMDPIVTGDEETDRIHDALSRFLAQENLMLHDLRRVPGKEQINLVFDVALPVDYQDAEGLRQRICAAAKALDPRYVCVIHFDMDFYHSPHS